MFTNLFDIINSRKLHDKGPFRHAFSAETEGKYLELFEKASKYIEGLKIEYSVVNAQSFVTRRVLVLENRWRTGFIVFLVVIRWLKEFYQLLIKSNELKYILTYKLSQDHLETLFSVLRSKGGYNDNLYCVQFKRAIKSVLMHTQ